MAPTDRSGPTTPDMGGRQATTPQPWRGTERQLGTYVIHADDVSSGQEVTVTAPHSLSFRAQVEVGSDDGLILWVQASPTLPRTLFARNPDSTTWTSR